MSLIQESFVGQALNGLSCRLFPHRTPLFAYPEEKPGYKAPAHLTKDYQKPTSAPIGEDRRQRSRSSSQTLVDNDEHDNAESLNATRRAEKDGRGPDAGEKSQAGKQSHGEDPDDDPLILRWRAGDLAHPQSWSPRKKIFVTAELCLFTSAVYIGSAIYSPGEVSLVEDFGISQEVAVLGLSLFVAGYGLSPMILAPLSEIPQIGRNNIYVITLIIFVLIQIPTALAPNIGTFLPLRFIAGCMGGPILATGGASIGDIWSMQKRAYAIAAWGGAAVIGPVMGPLIGGFAADAKGWRWTIWELMWLSGATLALVIFFMPETSAANILTRRARRLRRVTGNPNIKSADELAGEDMTTSSIAFEALARPFLLALDPIIFFSHLYIALAYGLLYVWLESFALVFTMGYGFNLGETGLAFLGIFVCALLSVVGVCIWVYYVYEPALKREGDQLKPEIRMHLAMFGCFFLPISLFWYGWTANKTHWIVPIIGAGMFAVGLFLIFQSILNYLGDIYPRYVASVYAGNDLFRSAFGAGFPLFATQMYTKLGTGWASTLLGCLSLLFCAFPFVLFYKGESIRKRSKYTS